MSSSLILTNCFFCGLAASLLLPLLRQPNILTYKKGIPIFVAIFLIFTKLLVPYEFSFTHTLASKKILPTITAIENRYIFENITIGNLLLCTWILISMLVLVYTLFKHWKLMKILYLVPAINNTEINQILSQLCIKKQIRNIPKVIQLDINIGPFIVGLRNPLIVLPSQLSNIEIRFILLHELEHFKHRHILIKSCTEIVTAIYWWNPVIWLIRREIISAMEMQADTHVIKGLPNKARLTYLESLIKVSKKVNGKQNANLALSFAFKSSMIEYRVRAALKFDCFQKDKKTSVFYIWPLALSIVLLFFSFIYTFESYNISPVNVAGTFIVKPETDYFVLRDDRLYDLYVNGEFAVTIPNIPEELSNLPIHK